MRTAIDTVILVDVFKADTQFGERSLQLLNQQFRQGALLITEIVYAELTPLFHRSQEDLDEVLQSLNIQIEAVGRKAAYMAGQRWRNYRQRGGSRTRIMSDFLIGAHAMVSSNLLLTRDIEFYRSHFPELLLADGR